MGRLRVVLSIVIIFIVLLTGIFWSLLVKPKKNQERMSKKHYFLTMKLLILLILPRTSPPISPAKIERSRFTEWVMEKWSILLGRQVPVRFVVWLRPAIVVQRLISLCVSGFLPVSSPTGIAVPRYILLRRDCGELLSPVGLWILRVVVRTLLLLVRSVCGAVIIIIVLFIWIFPAWVQRSLRGG